MREILVLADFKFLTQDGAEKRRGTRERNRALKGLYSQVTKSAGFRSNPRKHAGLRNEKGQPKAVGLYELVEGSGIECEFANTWLGHAGSASLKFFDELLPNLILHGDAKYCKMQRARPPVG